MQVITGNGGGEINIETDETGQSRVGTAPRALEDALWSKRADPLVSRTWFRPTLSEISQRVNWAPKALKCRIRKV